ncbi:HEAT repeat domain-containing protein [Spongiactinospora sp. 9N601]|uniref:HEAT repeat domain-containing protein n=1 Tax=Spongiactinospora sp. 9N601 TaxID=3375149 RepID=UPI00378C4590
MRSPQKEVRERAREDLYSAILHQGSRCPASADAVPYLVPLAIDRATPERHEILTMLAELAVSLDPDLARRDTPPDDDPAYDAVREAVPVLLPLTTDRDPLVRAHAAHVLGWFPADSAAIAPALRGLIARDRDPGVVATALLALSLLPPTGESIELATRHFEAGRTRDVAALALVALRGPQAPRPARIRVLELRDARTRAPVPYRNGDLAALAIEISERIADDLADHKVTALVDRLRKAAPTETFWIVSDLLEAAFATDPAPARRHTALSAIAALDPAAWRRGDLPDILRAWDLPTDRAALARVTVVRSP